MIARTLLATGQSYALHGIDRVDAVADELWRGVIHVLRFESQLVPDADLTTIEDSVAAFRAKALEVARAESDEILRRKIKASGHLAGADFTSLRSTPPASIPFDNLAAELRTVTARVRYLRLKKIIRQGQNPAVNVDRQVLLSRLQALGFSEKLADASNIIEERALVSVTELDVKSVMDLVRTFLEEFVEEACRKIEGKAGKVVPSGPKVNHYQPYREYLEHAGIVGREESVLLQSLYNFLSNTGTHRLGSAPEQLQVARVTVIEWCLVVAGRVQAFLA